MKLNSLHAGPRGSFHEPSRSVRRRLLYGKGHFYKQQFGSLAFGGRGVGLLHNARNWSVAHVRFDSTKGFPGEGWSQGHPNFRIGTWNTRSMTRERFAYCKSLGYDVLAVTEQWRTQDRFQTNDKAFIVAEARIDKDTEKVRYPKDRAAGTKV